LNKSTDGGKKNSRDHKFDTVKAIASAVNMKVNKRMKSSIQQEKSTNEETDAYIASVVDKHLAKTAGKIVQISDATSTPTPAAAAPTLKSIIKRTKETSTGRRYHHAMQLVNQSWDPGNVQDHEERTQLCKTNVPDYLYSLMSTTMVSDIDVSEEATDMDEEESRTELDSHANMPVVGRNAYIISDTGRIADVNPFTPDYASTMRISIVDAAVIIHRNRRPIR
jgi:hypothetical protein